MSTADGQIWITFNGEIFNYIELRKELLHKNHRFLTRSDTEVILHLYVEEGEQCVRRLNGQWAFAIWDAPRRKLFLSRDRMGVKPLFYTQTFDTFLFASEIKALFASAEVEPALDLHGLGQVFMFWVTLPPRTAFQHISQLPPGHSLVLENGTIRISQHWRLDFVHDGDSLATSEERLTEELLELLLDATRIRLRSDVPVGTYLSGGLDSTFVTALTKLLAGDYLHTFSVGFDDSEFDESQYQEEAHKFLKSQHTALRCAGRDIARVFPDVVRHTEQPILRTAPAPLYMLAKLVRESGFKVVLTGEGADETMGGYDIFKEAKIRRFCGRMPNSHMRPLLLKRLYPYMHGIQRQPPAYLKKFFCADEENLASPFFSHLPRWQMTAKMKTFLSEAARAEIESFNMLDELGSLLPAAYYSWSAPARAEYLETTYLLPGYILSSQGDRMAMAHSVEARHPFLDYRVVEFAAKLPATLKMKVLDEKYLLKRASRGLIPEAIQMRCKQPYRAPDGKCFFRHPAYTQDFLSAECIEKHGIFDPVAVGALVRKFATGRAIGVTDDMALLGILSTQILLEQFGHGPGSKTEYDRQHYNVDTRTLATS
jgi:asparagine synthase (glutamine-hydrolysing)